VKTGKCRYDDDVLPILEKISEADGVVIGSPVYFGDVPSQLKALIDRERVIRKQWGSFDGKVGASVAVAWKWGHVKTLETINTFFTVNKMVQTGIGGIPGIGLMVFAREKGEVKGNEEALNSARSLGKRIVETTGKISG
jgi:multimeric flavodoxin WrbA